MSSDQPKRMLWRVSLLLLVTHLSACSGAGNEATGPSGPRVTQVSVLAESDSLEKLATRQLSALLRDSAGQVVEGRSVTWKSSDPEIATVSNTGLVAGLAAGVVVISASVDGVFGDRRLTITPRYLRFSTLAAGTHQTCGVTTEGKTYCWGAGVGTGFTNHPVLVPGAPALKVLATSGTGSSHFSNCGLTDAGKAYCWGQNDFGVLGVGDTPARSDVPLAVNGGISFTSIGGGAHHYCAAATSGEGYCWGMNYEGQLGDGTTTSRSSPTRVTGSLSFSRIADGLGLDYHTCALTTAGRPYCWGDNGYFGIGDGTTTDRTVPTAVAGNLVFRDLAVTQFSSCGLTEAGQVYCWGRSLPSGGYPNEKSAATPVLEVATSNFRSLSAGLHSMCALDSAGKAYCWGYNEYGSVGDNTFFSKYSPTAVVGGLTFRTLTSGNFHTCGIVADGRAFCWGLNNNGQLGGAPLQSQFGWPKPQPVAPPPE